MKSVDHDLVVIGAGPGGYVAAIRAAQLGLNVGCVEKESALGGTCLRIGCIPSKALLESSELFHQAKSGLVPHGINIAKVSLDLAAMQKRKQNVVSALTKGVEALFRKGKITRYLGHARIDGPGRVVVEPTGSGNSDQTLLQAGRILIAAGSKTAGLRGVELDGRIVGTSTEALAYDKVPETLVVIGAGAIGLELGSVWNRLGSKVIVLEYMDRILVGFDTELAGEALKEYRKQGMDIRLGCRVTAARIEDGHCSVDYTSTSTTTSREAQKDEKRESLICDRVLVAVGRIPNTEGLGLETVGIELDEKRRIPVNSEFATSADGIYAIGDVIRGPMLAHKAEEEGVACVEGIVTGYGHVDYNTIPNIVYTHPELASVGRNEEELIAEGVPYRKGSFPFRANGRARSLGQVDGRVKILAHTETDRILGVHIFGPRAGDLIAEAVAAMAFGASSEDLARTVHAHPTLAEAVREAALDVDGRAIHS